MSRTLAEALHELSKRTVRWELTAESVAGWQEQHRAWELEQRRDRSPTPIEQEIYQATGWRSYGECYPFRSRGTSALEAVERLLKQFAEQRIAARQMMMQYPELAALPIAPMPAYIATPDLQDDEN